MIFFEFPNLYLPDKRRIAVTIRYLHPAVIRIGRHIIAGVQYNSHTSLTGVDIHDHRSTIHHFSWGLHYLDRQLWCWGRTWLNARSWSWIEGWGCSRARSRRSDRRGSVTMSSNNKLIVGERCASSI